MDTWRFDPNKLGERSMRAYRGLEYDGQLADGTNIWDGGWHRWADVVGLMLRHSDITPKSCSDILRGMEAQGMVARRGRFKPGNDQRELRFQQEDDPEIIRDDADGRAGQKSSSS